MTEKYPVVNGLLYLPGTMLPVHDLYGSQANIFDLNNKEEIEMDENGLLQLKTGHSYELSILDKDRQQKAKEARKRSSRHSRAIGEENMEGSSSSISSGDEKRRNRTLTVPSNYVTTSQASLFGNKSANNGNEGFFKTLRMKNFGNSDASKEKKKEARKSNSGEVPDLLQDLKQRRISFLESKGLVQSGHLKQNFPPVHEVLQMAVLNDKKETCWLLLKGYKLSISKSENFHPVELELNVDRIEARILDDSNSFMIDYKDNAMTFVAASKDEICNMVSAINTNAAVLLSYAKKNNCNVSTLLHGDRIQYSNEYLSERKYLEVDVLSTINEMMQPLEFDFDGKLTLLSYDHRVANDRDKTLLAKYSEIAEFFVSKKEKTKQEKNIDVFEFLRKGLNNSSGSILEGKDLAWKRLLVKLPSLDEGVEVTTEEKMINYLLDQGFTDLTFVGIFLTTFRHVIPPTCLMDKLIAKFNQKLPDKPSEELCEMYKNVKPVVQLRKWVEQFWFDFHTEEMKEKIEAFVLLCKFPNSLHPIDSTLNEIYGNEKRGFAQVLADLIQRQERKSSQSSLKEVSKVEKVKTTFVELDYKEIAIYITSLNVKQFQNVRPFELLIQLWGSSNDPIVQKETAELNELINFFNAISYWTATEICTQPEVKMRQKVIERFIKIMRELKKLNNLNCLIAILSGLNLSAVSRLKQTWEGIQPKYMNLYQEIENFVSPEYNYKSYRAFLDELDHTKLEKVGCIPFYGLYIKDLTFINDGNPAKFNNEYINFSKLRLINDKILEIKFFQSLSYELPETSSVTKEYIDNLKYLKEPALYKYSCLCETKGGGTVRMIDKWAKDNKN